MNTSRDKGYEKSETIQGICRFETDCLTKIKSKEYILFCKDKMFHLF